MALIFVLLGALCVFGVNPIRHLSLETCHLYFQSSGFSCNSE